MRRFFPDDSATAVTEYGLFAVFMIGVVTIFGSDIASWFANKACKNTSF